MHRPGWKSGLASILALASVATASTASAVTTIDFDELDAPCVFADAAPLAVLPSAPGVRFGGPEAGGGAVLGACSQFQVAPRSGNNFLAFNRGAMFEQDRPRDAETIAFDAPVELVSIWASGGETATSFAITAFDGDAFELGTTTVEVAALAWGELRIAGSEIASVVLRETGGDNTFVYDDLSFGSADSIPEPRVPALLALSLAALGLARRRPRALAAA